MRIAVVGAGIGGLAAARALRAAGHDAVVLDAQPRPGGVIATTTADGFVREHAASSFLGGPPHGALALCNELGVAVDKASPRARNRWIYIDGKLRALPRNPIELVTTDLLTWRGKLDLVREPLRPRGVDGDESVYAFASRRLGAEAARAIVAPFVTGVFGADAHEISLEAGFPRLAALDRQGGLIRGMATTMVKGIAGRFRGAPKAPGDKKTPRGMYAPKGGVGTLVAALAGSLGDRVREARVSRIEPAGDGVAIDGERWDACVLAIPAQDAAAIVAIPELAKRLAEFDRAPMALVFLGYDADAFGDATGGFGFLSAQGEDVRVLGVVFETTVWPGRAPDGKLLLRCLYGGGRDRDATTLSDRELVDQARRDVSRALGRDPAPSHASVVRVARGVAQYRVGHRDRVRDAVALARGQRIVLAGADYRGAGVNDLCADAAVVAAEVAAW
jgi:oxygen-dependent protoporphyrinogen oxidase